MRYDKVKDCYYFNGAEILHKHILDSFGVQYADRSYEISGMLTAAYAAHFGDKITPNDIHRFLLDYQRDKILPEWVAAVYEQRAANVRQ